MAKWLSQSHDTLTRDPAPNYWPGIHYGPPPAHHPPLRLPGPFYSSRRRHSGIGPLMIPLQSRMKRPLWPVSKRECRLKLRRGVRPWTLLPKTGTGKWKDGGSRTDR